MPARRCSICAIDYPTVGVHTCHVCGGPLSHIGDTNPDEDWETDVARKLHDEPGGDDDKVARWRLLVLLDAGYPLELADSIAAASVDLHQAVDMVGAGCPPETAARILL